MPFFTVVIPAYNRAALVPKTLDSVLAQELTDFEVIVVDDGSADGTVEVVESFIERFGGRLLLLRQPNRGPGPARNCGIRQARGRYVAFLDSDDLWFPWTLCAYRQAIADAGEPAGLFGRPLKFTAEAELAGVERAALVKRVYDDYLASVDADMYRGTGVAVWRADLLREAGGFVEHDAYGEDLELFLRMGLAGPFVHVMAPPLIAVRRHPGGSAGNMDRHFRGAMYLIDQERAGRLPGGQRRRRERLPFVSNHGLQVSLMCLEQGRVLQAWRLYLRTFWWHVAQRRTKFLLGFVAATIAPRLNPMRTKRKPASGTTSG